ncbi:hypothetical protein [Absidia glauca]|uniref:Ndc10 domain-containing protein n=1 Tax=Absidia glauca TaxID=4829 RepID=A0A168RV85_ABSGL|nr:hypothetical protein [Absidia glauca]
MEQDETYIYPKILYSKYTCAVCFSGHYIKRQNSDWIQWLQSRSFIHRNPTTLSSFGRSEALLPSLRTDLRPGQSWDLIRNEDKTAPPGTGMVLLFSSAIDQQGPLFSWYQVQQKDTYQLRLISSYGGKRVCERGSNTTPRPMKQHNDKRRISHQLPRELVRSVAGFPINGRSFYLARAALNPPTSLCKKLFPAIGERHDRLAAKELSPGDLIHLNFAENAFIQVIVMFRNTFIQDSVLMMELHPCYPIWQYSIFSDPAYLSFKRDMLQIEAQEHDPAHTLLQQCVPLHSRFQTPVGYKIFFLPVYYFAPSSPRHYFFASIVILFTPRRQTNEQTSRRTNER